MPQKDNIIDVVREMPINFIDMDLPPTSSLHSVRASAEIMIVDGCGDGGWGGFTRPVIDRFTNHFPPKCPFSRQKFAEDLATEFANVFANVVLCFAPKCPTSGQNFVLPAASQPAIVPPATATISQPSHELMHRYLTTSLPIAHAIELTMDSLRTMATEIMSPPSRCHSTNP
jgi:hypothetical protein